MTGNRYRFRDLGWSAGHAVEIRRVYEYLQSEHPRIAGSSPEIRRSKTTMGNQRPQ